MFSLAFNFGPWLIAAALAIVAWRYAAAAKAGNLKPPFVINQGAAMTAIQNAVSGNPAAALIALIESVHLQVAAGSVEEHLLQGGFKELELRAADPNAKLPIMDYIAHFSNRPRDQVIAFFEAEAGITRQTPAPAPAPSPAAVAAAFLLCLFFVPAAEARSPIRTPDRWYPERQEVQIDPAVFSSPVSIDQRGQILWPDSAYVRHGEPIYPDSYRPIYYQPAYQSNTVGFWQAGPARRFVSAPFRWRPLRRLFGRRC
jgi:hypothetical protein